MTWHRFLLIVTLGLGLAAAAPAGIIFNRHPKPSAQRAQELIGVVKGDANESKRAAAADELGSYDGSSYPEIAPALIAALRDSSTTVRAQAVQSLGKLRPVTPEAGQALEQAMANDSSTKVRLEARTTLWQYRVAGYRSPKGESAPTAAQPTSAEPKRTTVFRPAPAPQAAQPRIVPQPAPVSNEPPLAAPTAPPPLPRPLPSAPPMPVPAPMPKLEPPPAAAPVDQGPSLTPPG